MRKKNRLESSERKEFRRFFAEDVRPVLCGEFAGTMDLEYF